MQVVAPLWGSALDPGCVLLALGGQANHVFLVVVIGSHGVRYPLEGLPSEWADISPSGPLLDAGKAKVM